MDNTVRIKDTGKATSDGDVVYTQYDNGNWIDLQGFNLTFESCNITHKNFTDFLNPDTIKSLKI